VAAAAAAVEAGPSDTLRMARCSCSESSEPKCCGREAVADWNGEDEPGAADAAATEGEGDAAEPDAAVVEATPNEAKDAANGLFGARARPRPNTGAPVSLNGRNAGRETAGTAADDEAVDASSSKLLLPSLAAGGGE
jgi:hypothetical protein